MGYAAFTQGLLFIAGAEPVVPGLAPVRGASGQPVEAVARHLLQRLAHVVGDVRGHAQMRTGPHHAGQRCQVFGGDEAAPGKVFLLDAGAALGPLTADGATLAEGRLWVDTTPAGALEIVLPHGAVRVEGKRIQMEKGAALAVSALHGLFIGRTQYFKNYLTETKFTKQLWVGALILLGVSILSMVGIFASMGPNVDFNSWTAMFGLTFFDLMNLAFTVLIVAVFVILYKKKRAGKFLRSFIPYGKMALTNYVFQSILGTFIFFGWGLGQLSNIPNRYSFLIAIAIIVLQMLLSKWWLRYFKYGPLEWVWRSLTFFKVFPLKRQAPTSH